jgi:hypothetical protein
MEIVVFRSVAGNRQELFVIREDPVVDFGPSPRIVDSFSESPTYDKLE